MSQDPVVVRRRQILKWTSIGQRTGYGCFGTTLLLFFFGLIFGFPSWALSLIIVLLIVGSVILLPSIVLSYAAKAADSEDRGEPFTY